MKTYKIGDREIQYREETADIAIIEEVLHNQYGIAGLFDKESFIDVVDIGAHIGTFTIMVKNLYPNARVIAAEGNKQNVSMCELNLGNVPDVELVGALVVGNRKQTGDTIKLIHDMPDGRTQCWSRYNWSNFTGELIDTPVCEFNEIIEKRAKIDLVKMDVEGSEFDIMRYTKPQNLLKIKWMVMELHNNHKQQDELIEDLKQYFSVVELHRDTNNPDTNSVVYLKGI